MKLDRNTNPNGRGKYALVNMRKLGPMLDQTYDSSNINDVRDMLLVSSFNLLVSRGIITLGNESPGDQFFVMKYKDRFTGRALLAYANAARDDAAFHYDTIGHKPTSECLSLIEYAGEMHLEYLKAAFLGTRTPD